MLKYLVKRILSLIPTILLITVLIFCLLEATPGDPLTRLIPIEMLETMDMSTLERLREHYGLNDPVFIRYFRWLGGVLTGDFGNSMITGIPIAQTLGNLLPNTIKLAVAGLILSTILGLTFGILASVNQNGPADWFCSIVGMLGISFPEVFLAITVMQTFAIKLKWFPAGGDGAMNGNFFTDLKYLVMPACCMGFSLTCALMRYTRGAMLDVMNKDYVKTARAKGLSQFRVLYKHVFRNALMPVMLLLTMRLPMLIGGSVILESIFSWTGIGGKSAESVIGKDFNMVMITTLMGTLLSLSASVLVDVFTAMLDPRVRMGASEK